MSTVQVPKPKPSTMRVWPLVVVAHLRVEHLEELQQILTIFECMSAAPFVPKPCPIQDLLLLQCSKKGVNFQNKEPSKFIAAAAKLKKFQSC